MTSFTTEEVDERAFAMFLRQGILYFLDQDPVLRHGDVILCASHLRQTWIQMSSQAKAHFLLRAREELNRLRGDPTSEIFRSVLRNMNSQ
jgi:hypothetical protein